MRGFGPYFFLPLRQKGDGKNNKPSTAVLRNAPYVRANQLHKGSNMMSDTVAGDSYIAQYVPPTKSQSYRDPVEDAKGVAPRITGI